MSNIINLAQNLRALRSAVQSIKESTEDRVTVITQEVEFTPADHKEYGELLNQIKLETLTKIASFYQTKITERTKTYQTELNNCEQDYQDTAQQISEQQDLVKQLTENNLNKHEFQNRMILNLIINQEKLAIKKVIFRAFKGHIQRKQKKRLQTHDAELRYENKLLHKVFFPWRATCHKNGYQNILIKQASKDIKQIQLQFLDMIKVLKTKIAETDDQLQIKKNAKAEFSYSLSRNLLKIISNLQLEVVSLNQIQDKKNFVHKEL